MPFRPPKPTPQFADLKGILAQSKQTEDAIYQVIQSIIERLDQLKINVVEKIDGNAAAAILHFATRDATYHTKEDETGALPNSVQLLAGANVIFDDSVANQRTISVGGGAGVYDDPLTDGILPATELIFADGNCIIVQVPL